MRASLVITSLLAASAVSLAAVTSAAAAAAKPSAVADAANERTIDSGASKARFSIEHIFVARVNGTVPILRGVVTLSGGSVIPLSVTATLDADRLDTGDPDQTAAVRGADYFDTQKFPTWTFASTKIVPHGAAAFGMDGTLTMHGVAQPEHLDVTVSGDAAHPRYEAIAHIGRHAFGMRGARLDPVIGAVADVTLDVSLKQP